MPWIIFLFVILPVIAILANTFEHGHGALIIVPLFGLIAATLLWWLRRITKDSVPPVRSFLRIGGLLVCAYL